MKGTMGKTNKQTTGRSVAGWSHISTAASLALREGNSREWIKRVKNFKRKNWIGPFFILNSEVTKILSIFLVITQPLVLLRLQKAGSFLCSKYLFCLCVHFTMLAQTSTRTFQKLQLLFRLKSLLIENKLPLSGGDSYSCFHSLIH